MDASKRPRARTRIARRLRQESTEVEKRLWRALRELDPIGRCIVDFACPGRRLVIELDGGQHAMQTEADAVRTSEIARYG
jgi:very-short-patch-repair endonuclease